ncbi:hypothetical protein [Membranihabitans maritimus]|uniref:hypothetical protein n=1 Tax=Membranihabitans maritimus TaxID=2904244 RepID=UPI001F35BCB6|nr:hypothetical protein [Membranihabitans maritimus]
MQGQRILVSEALDVRTDLTYELLGKFGDKYMLASYSDYEFTIHNYNPELYLTSNQEFELENKNSDIIHIFSDPNEERFNILHAIKDRDTTYVVNQPYKPNLESERPDTLLYLARSFQSYRFRYTFSEDKSKMGLLVMQGGDLIGYLVYDLIYKEPLFIDFIDPEQGESGFGKFDFYDDYRKSVVTNSGILYMIFEQNNYYFKREEHAFYIFKARDAGDLVTAHLPMKNLLTYDAFFSYDNYNNKLLICGLGSEKNLDRARVIFQVKQDPKSFSDFEITTFSFQENLLNDFYGNNNKSRRDYLQNVRIQDVLLVNDGGAILVLEEVKEMERVTSGGRIDYYGSRYTVDYHYENLMLFYLSADSKKLWQKLLPKRQYSNDDEGAYSSYFVFKNPNHLRFIYNDEIRNENTVSEYLVRPNGASLRTNLLSTDFQKLRLQVRNAVQTTSHQVLIPSLRGKILKLLLIDYLN